MIQLALVGQTPVVVEHGLGKSIPSKLYILHTKNEPDYQYESEAAALRTKIQREYKIPVELRMIGAFDMKGIIDTILSIIFKEMGIDSTLTKEDFAINITGGTNLMVSAASTAAYLAGAKLYYVMDTTKYRGDTPVIELPLPTRPENNSRGKTSKTTAIILEKIKKLGKCNNMMLLESVRKDRRLKKNQRIDYHLRKLRDMNIISIRDGWEYMRNGKPRTDHKRKTIQLTDLGLYPAEFPDLLGDLLR